MSGLAANLLNFALVIRVFDLTRGTKVANIAVSLLIMSFAVPSIIFAVFAGAYVDHLDRRKVLYITNFVRAALVLFFLFFESNLLVVYGLVFVISIFTQFFVPAEAAALPKLVKRQELLSANSLFLFSFYGSFVVGYALAGPIVAQFGPTSVYIITGGAFLLAGILTITLPSLKPEAAIVKWKEINQQVFGVVRASTREIFSTPRLVFPIFHLTVGQALLGVVAVLTPGLALLLFGKSLAQASIPLIVPAAITMVLGAIAIGQFGKHVRKTTLINYGLALAVIGLVGMSLAKYFQGLGHFTLIIIGISAVLGLANALVTVSAQTLLQMNSTDETRGKIFGTLNMMVNVAALVPVLLAGVTADLISPFSVLLIIAGLLFVYGLVQFSFYHRLNLRTVE